MYLIYQVKQFLILLFARKNVKFVNSNIKQNLCDSALRIVSKQQLRLTGETYHVYLIKVSFVFNVNE